jgi:hypothetical protein
MERARRLYASAGALGLAVVLTALVTAGCGSSGSETGGSTSSLPASGHAPAGATAHGCAASAHEVGQVRVTGVACSTAVEVAAAWATESGCRLTASASRGACTVGRYRCLTLSADRGLLIGCARPGRSISFIAPRR